MNLLFFQVGYLPIIDSSPTEMSTIMAILQRSIRIADELELGHVVISFDQAIYSKTQTIRFQNPVFKERLILRLGEFHTSMAFMAVIGRRFENSGLQELIVDSGVIAAGSVAGVLSGTFYNRSARCYKLLAEALCRLMWEDFIASIEYGDLQQKALQFAIDLNDSFPQRFEELACSEEGKNFARMFQNYRRKKEQENPNYCLWSSLLDMIETLLLFIRGTREGNFDLHLAAVRLMLPWFFAYDRQNYARYLSIYYSEMMQLKVTHPAVYTEFCKGQFVVQRHAEKPFSGSACDLVIEQTVNREAKSGMTQCKLFYIYLFIDT